MMMLINVSRLIDQILVSSPQPLPPSQHGPHFMTSSALIILNWSWFNRIDSIQTYWFLREINERNLNVDWSNLSPEPAVTTSSWALTSTSQWWSPFWPLCLKTPTLWKGREGVNRKKWILWDYHTSRNFSRRKIYCF